MAALEFARSMLELSLEKRKGHEELERLRRERLEGVMRAASACPHYQKTICGINFGKEGLPGLPSFPIVEKNHVRDSPGSFMPKGTDTGALIPLRTSGSTGKPLGLFISKETAGFRSALVLSTLMGCGLTPMDVYSLIETRRRHDRPVIHWRWGVFRTLMLDMFKDDEANLEEIRRHRVTRLSTAPGVLESMAQINRESRNPALLKSAFSGGEVLAQSAREAIESSFSCRVFNVYSCWEFGVLASECPIERNLHVKGESVMLEIVDRQGRPRKSGIGEVVVTSLRNYAMPLIRYRLGDLASWGGECPCGRPGPILKSLEGRSDDLIILPSGKVRSPMAFNLNNLPGVVHGIKSYTLIQENEGRFTFRYVPAKKPAPQAVLDAISSQIKFACLGEEIRVDFEDVEEIPLGRNGKQRKVVSRMAKKPPAPE